MNILGINIDFFSQEEVKEQIDAVIKKPKKVPFFIITANGEFVLHAQKDSRFALVLRKADLVLPDGVSLAQAREFIQESRITTAWKIFCKTVSGGYTGQTVRGVDIVRFGLESVHQVFLLGGYHGVARLLAEKYQCAYHPGFPLKTLTGEQNQQMLAAIKKVQPDILFVAFGHFTQEQWIAQNLARLSCKIVMGVGSSFDELAGVGLWRQPVPRVFRIMGLKWLWRLGKNPSHIGRVWQAAGVFPWKIYKESVRYGNY